MAQLGNLIVTGVTRLLSKLYVNDSVTAPTFIGQLQGNADTATKATQDSAGQQINTTYIKGLSVSGRTITYTKGNGTTGTITTQDNNTTYGVATTSANGLMSSGDKSKLDGIASGANKYNHPSYTARNSGLYKVTVDGSGHVSAVTNVVKADITALGIPGSDTNTTYPMYTKTIDGSYTSQFRTQTKGDAANGGYITAIRNNTASVANSPQYGSGIAFGMSDTHGYLYYNYSDAAAYVGAGNADKLNWTKQLAFTDSTVANASKVNNHTVNSDVPSGAKFTDTVYTHPTSSGNKHIPSGGSSGQILRWSSDGTAVWGNDNNTTYTLSSITGTLAVAKGGTGSTTAAGGRAGLGAVGFLCQKTEPSGQNDGDLWFAEE